ncbi:transposase [Nocardia sp. NPDC059764]|uniref:transposase n=1 Tax=Nocardia sp. NPDC059764 TaxID=3346939 RepID=UPI00365EB2DB
MFGDLFTDIGRRSVPPMIVAVVLALHRIEGYSDREAVERFAFDTRWKYAAGGLAFECPGVVHTVLVECARGWPARIGRTTFSMLCSMSRARPGWWVGAGCDKACSTPAT